MATFLTHLKSALRMNDYIQSGDTPTANEQTDGLAIANRMLDSWNIEGLLCYSIQRTTHTLVASTNPQTIGSGGNINTDRPVEIEQAGLIIAGEDTEQPITVLDTMAEYAEIVSKETESSTPTYLFYDPAFPLGKIYTYPVLNAANTLVLYRWTPFTSIATVGTAVTFPPGYESFFVSSLAKALAAEGLGILNQATLLIANDAMAAIKKKNFRVPIMKSDWGGQVRGRQNILTNWGG